MAAQEQANAYQISQTKSMAQLIRVKLPGGGVSKKWYSDFEWGGKRIRRALHEDKRIAERRLEDLLVMRSADRHGYPVKKISWGLFVERYLEYSKTEKVDNTYGRDKFALALLSETFPIQELDQVTPDLLSRAKARWKESPRHKVPAINRHLTAIKAAMKKAEEWGYTSQKPWRIVKLFKTPQGRLDFYTMPELSELRKQIEPAWEVVVLLGARAGLRRGEIFHLEWTDIDFERSRIHIVPKPHMDWIPKDHERRWVPMTNDLKGFLEGLPERQGFVFRCGFTRTDVMTHIYTDLARKAGFRGSLHTLRHTFGAHNAMAGVNLRTLQKWMGHATIRTTEIYAHLQEDVLDQEIQKLPAMV